MGKKRLLNECKCCITVSDLSAIWLLCFVSVAAWRLTTLIFVYCFGWFALLLSTVLWAMGAYEFQLPLAMRLLGSISIFILEKKVDFFLLIQVCLTCPKLSNSFVIRESNSTWEVFYWPHPCQHLHGRSQMSVRATSQLYTVFCRWRRSINKDIESYRPVIRDEKES